MIIFEKSDANEWTLCSALDASIISKRWQKEKEWVLKLQTYFAYGLNKQLDDDFLQEETHVTSLCGCIFKYI